MTPAEIHKYEQEELAMFLQRNQNYVKHSDVPPEVIAKYTGVLPEAILTVWQQLGFGIFEQGFVQFVNPDEWEFVFDYIDNIFERSVVFGITALGDLLIWDIPNQGELGGNHVILVYVNDYTDEVISSNAYGFLGRRLDVNCEHLETFNYYAKLWRAKNYHKVKHLLPSLQYGECYGYVPIPALGGKKSYKTLQVVNAKAYVDLIGQSVGKFIDLGY